MTAFSSTFLQTPNSTFSKLAAGLLAFALIIYLVPAAAASEPAASEPAASEPDIETAHETESPGVLGFDHVGLAVFDLEASKNFFTEVLGFEVVGKDADYPAYFLNNGQAFVTLWRVEDPATAIRFDRKNNIGLHHLALRVESEEALTTLYEIAKTFPGVKIEFAPELSYGGPSKHMMVYEPSGNRIEIVFRPKK